MTMRRKRLFRLIAATLVLSIVASANVNLAVAAQRETYDVYEKNGIKVETKVPEPGKNRTVYSVQDEKTGMDYTLDMERSNDKLVSKMYDKDGALLNTVVCSGNEVVQFDANGNITGQQTIETTSTNEISPNSITWQDKRYVDGNAILNANDNASAINLVVSIIVNSLKLNAYASALVAAIQFLVQAGYVSLYDYIFYSGWVQIGTEYGTWWERYYVDLYADAGHQLYLRSVFEENFIH